MLLELGVWHETRVCSEIKKKKGGENCTCQSTEDRAQASMLRTQAN